MSQQTYQGCTRVPLCWGLYLRLGRSSLGANRPGSEEGGVRRHGCREESPVHWVGVERLNRWEKCSETTVGQSLMPRLFPR